MTPQRDSGKHATVALFRGCVMDTLFRHVHDATRRTLEANGYTVVEPQGQACCGALHEHAGDRAAAEALARENVAALTGSADYVVVNSAGCGALLKGYGHLLGTEAAAELAAKVRDVSELLAEAGPRPGGALPLDVAYDAPCHLQHAQRVQAAPLAVLAAIPALRLRLLPSSDKCCGSAGIYSVVRPAMARAVLDLKLESFASAAPVPEIVATGNPGCLMQIGAGVRAAGLAIRVVHPVELLDESYRVGGVYETTAAGGRRSGGEKVAIAVTLSAAKGACFRACPLHYVQGDSPGPPARPPDRPPIRHLHDQPMIPRVPRAPRHELIVVPVQPEIEPVPPVGVLDQEIGVVHRQLAEPQHAVPEEHVVPRLRHRRRQRLRIVAGRRAESQYDLAVGELETAEPPVDRGRRQQLGGREDEVVVVDADAAAPGRCPPASPGSARRTS